MEAEKGSCMNASGVRVVVNTRVAQEKRNLVPALEMHRETTQKFTGMQKHLLSFIDVGRFLDMRRPVECGIAKKLIVCQL